MWWPQKRLKNKQKRFLSSSPIFWGYATIICLQEKFEIFTPKLFTRKNAENTRKVRENAPKHPREKYAKKCAKFARVAHFFGACMEKLTTKGLLNKMEIPGPNQEWVGGVLCVMEKSVGVGVCVGVKIRVFPRNGPPTPSNFSILNVWCFPNRWCESGVTAKYLQFSRLCPCQTLRSPQRKILPFFCEKIYFLKK